MIRTIKLGKLNIKLVFRHKWDETSKCWASREFNEYHLGVWYKNYDVVGKKNFGNPSKWKDNLLKQHMFGVTLIVCKFWITIDAGATVLRIPESGQRPKTNQ